MSTARGLSGSFWPNPMQEALLRVAFAPEDEVAARWRDVGPLRIEALEIGTLALLPVVLVRLLEDGVEDDRLGRLKGAHHSIWYRNQLQLDRLRPLADALDAVGIEPLALGGAPLATVYYDQLGLRPIVQLELAIDPSQTTKTAAVFEALRWRRTGGGGRYQTDDGSVQAVVYEGAPPYLAAPLSPAETLALWRSRAIRREIGGRQMLVLDPADELVVACGLGARRMVPQSAQWIVDVRTILVSSAPSPRDVAQRASELHLVPAVRATLAYLARVSRSPDLAPYDTALGAAGASRRDAIAYRLAGAGAGRLGPPPTALVSYARSTVALPLGRTVAGIPKALETAWGLDGAGRLPKVALRKAVVRLRPRDERHSSSPRNNSASS
jgi:hypothetical protein